MLRPAVARSTALSVGGSMLERGERGVVVGDGGLLRTVSSGSFSHTQQHTAPPQEKEGEVVSPSFELSSKDNPSSVGYAYFQRLISYILPGTQLPSTSEPIRQSPSSSFSSSDSVKKPPRSVTSVPRVTPPRPKRRAMEEKTSLLVRNLKAASSSAAKLHRTEDLCKYLMEYPEIRSLAVQEKVVPLLLRFERLSKDDALRSKSRQCISLLGHIKPLTSNGVRILSLDGGGTRGMMALEVLGALEAQTGKRIHELFDIVVGVSTGAILGTLLAGLRVTVPQAKEIYRGMSRKLFDQNRVVGMGGLLWSHSYYDTDAWTSILKQAIGDQFVIETAKIPGSPKLCIVSCVVNKPMLGAYIFRNYHHPPGRESMFPGSVRYRLWQALQASAAAPGYFEEVKLDQWLHQDGGLLVNNPSAVGVHESRVLWPESPIQCLVSVGNGRTILSVATHDPDSDRSSSSLKEKVNKIVDSATDTEMTHTTMQDLLPWGSYYRLNPYISHPYPLDEIGEEKLAMMDQDARLYIRKNVGKIKGAAAKLTETKSVWGRIQSQWEEQKNLIFS